LDDSCKKNGIDCRYRGRGRFSKPCEKCRKNWYDKGKSTHYKKPKKNKKKVKNDLDLLDSKTIYENIIKCESHLTVVKIEEEAFYMCSNILDYSCKYFKEKNVIHGDPGDIKVKITIKIEEDID